MTARFRTDLPQLHGDVFIADGGLETYLYFKKGFELPEFASFVLLESPAGRKALEDYFGDFWVIAQKYGTGAVFETPTWRANPDWGEKLGYDLSQLEQVNGDSVELLSLLRARSEGGGAIVISGAIGPRGDGYKATTSMAPSEARDYHSWQVSVLAETDADLASAFSLNYADEATGIVLAARQCEMPVVISFTVETDGNLVTGQPLGDAIRQVDGATGGHASYFMVNCAHPTHFESQLSVADAWRERVRGVRANASSMSHAELDVAEELDEGDPAELASQYRRLQEELPGLRVVGGCCGTDHVHVAAIAEALLG